MTAETDTAPGNAHTTAERISDRELVVTRTFAAPARLVYEAWTSPELLMRWWTPKSFGITFVSCEADVRTGGAYKFVMSHPSAPEPMAFFGRYTDVQPPSRLVWTNEESDDGGQITTVTFEERGDHTVVTMHELYPSKGALDEACASQATSGYTETFAQLDDLLAA